MPITRESVIPRYRSKWGEVLLVCAKCTRKAKGGFGPGKRRPLAKMLRKKLHLAKGRAGALGIVEVGCFKLCPKKAVTVVRGSEPDALYAVPVGTRSRDIIAALQLAPEPGEGEPALP